MDVDELLPLSGLQHLVFCERQAALIHVEQLWRDDAATVQGQIVHERVDEPGTTAREGVRVARALPLVSVRLGVAGRADMVELHPDSSAPYGERPIPVEVKKGRTKHLRADEVQLCAQAMCLEEMFRVPVPHGWIFYASSRRRRKVETDEGLRMETAAAARRLRSIIDSCEVPPPRVPDRVCAVCSLEDVCLPRAVRRGARARGYLIGLVEEP